MAKVDPKDVIGGLVKRGYTPVMAAGIAGNMAQESGFRTDAVGDGGAAYGLVQWNDRKHKLVNFANSQGRNIADLDTQLDFIDHELKTSESKAFSALKRARDPREAAFYFSRHYERPNPKYANNSHRMGAAESFFKMINPISSAEASETPWQAPAADIDPAEFAQWEASQKPQQQQQAQQDIDPAEFAQWESSQPKEKTAGQKVGEVITDIGGGVLKGASNIGNTLISAADTYNDLVGNKNSLTNQIAGEDDEKNLSGIITGQTSKTARQKRSEAVDESLKSMGVDTESGTYQAGELAAEIAGTAGMGNALAIGAKALPIANKLAPAIASSGMKGANLAQKAAGGAITGAASTGLINPDDALAGGVVGAVLPPGLQGAKKLANAVGNKLAPKAAASAAKPAIGNEVKALARKAESLGIEIPVDRISKSKVVNAAAKTLDYVPFSGRQGVIDKMHRQTNQAVSRLIGEDTDDVVNALQKAEDRLGSAFDETLKNNAVKVDDEMLNGLSRVEKESESILSKSQHEVIKKQIDNLLEKGGDGVIKGRAAYNIKMLLDTMGKSSDTEKAHFARELKHELMGGLERSLGSDGAVKFAEVRKQYGVMKDLQKMADNSAEGGVSMAKLANYRGRSKELKELAKIAKTFVLERESAHGAAQRVVVGTVTGATAGIPGVIAGIAGGKAVNSLLSSKALRDKILKETAIKGGKPGIARTKANALARAAVKSAPVAVNALAGR